MLVLAVLIYSLISGHLKRVVYKLVHSTQFTLPRLALSNNNSMQSILDLIKLTQFEKTLRHELTGCWKQFQDRGRVGRPEHLPLQGFHRNQADSAHTLAQRCYGDIAFGQNIHK